MSTVAEPIASDPPTMDIPPIAATVATPLPADSPVLDGPCTLRPSDHGRRMAFEDFVRCDFEDGCLYELARGVVVVVHVPSIHHGMIVWRTSNGFALYGHDHPGFIKYVGHGSDCRIRLPWMASDRHPDLAVYLYAPPDEGPKLWTRWSPDLVVEVVSEGGEERDYVEKREEYLRAGVREYWILNPNTRILHALQRAGDTWQEETVVADATYRCPILPGMEVRPGDLFGP